MTVVHGPEETRQQAETNIAKTERLAFGLVSSKCVEGSCASSSGGGPCPQPRAIPDDARLQRAAASRDPLADASRDPAERLAEAGREPAASQPRG